ncbi:MAG TPA: amino acid permease [Steroidobacteraceae bacterium]|jgi:L-asparagine transporter-like permease
MADFSAIIRRESGLRRTLTARKLSMIAIGGAVGTGLFLGSGFAIGIAGPSVLVSYGIGALIALLLMGCLAEMTATHPTTGSFGTYAEHYVSPLAGFMVRYAYWTCIVLAVGTEVTAIALYMKFWFPTVPGWLWIGVFSGSLIAVNASSVSTFGTIEYWFSLLKITAIAAFILLAGYLVASVNPVQSDPANGSIGFRNYTAYGGFFPHGIAGMWVAVIMAVFSFLSIEMIAVAAGEAAQPEVAIISAFLSTVVRLIMFYILTLALMLAVLPWTQAGSTRSPFVMVMEAVRLPAAGGIMNFVILIAALSAMNSQLYISTRMMFSLSRAGQASRHLGTLTARGIPLNALLVSTSGIAVATVLSVVSPGRAFLIMVGISVFGAMFTWMMIFVTHFFFRRARNLEGNARAAFRMWGFPLTTLLGACLMAALLLTTAFTDAFRLTLVFGLPYLACLGLIYYLRFRGTAVAAP